MDVQYAFIFLVQLPVILAMARRPTSIEANIAALVAGFAVVAAVSAFTGETQSAGRAVAYYTDNANALGVPAAFATPLVLALATQRWREGRRMVAVGGTLVVLSMLIWAIAASASRGATIATAISTAVFFVFAEGLDLRGRQLRRLTAVVAVLAIVVVAFFATPLFPAKLKDRIMGTVPANDTTTVEDDRIALDHAGIRAFMSSPLVGTGFDNFRYVSQFYDPAATEHDPHNLVIQFLATTGIVGAAAAIFILGRWFVMMFRVARDTTSRAQREIVWALFCGFLGVMIVGLATPVIVLRPYWIIFGLGLSAVAAVTDGDGERADVDA
jgi:O-antigen ligase